MARGLYREYVVLCCLAFLQAGCQKRARVTAEGPSPQIAQSATVSEQESDVGSTNPPLERADADEAGPKIVFETVVYDLGEVAPQTIAAGQFRFGNAGNGLLRITKIERCCGFSTNLTKREYERGETGVLKMEFHAGPQAQLVKRQLVVHTNDRTQPRVALTVTAKVVEKVSCEPKRLVFLLQDDETACPEITLTSLDEKPFSVRGFISTADCLIADYDPARQASRFVLKPSLNLENVQEGMTGLIHINLTHPECDKVTLSFKALGRFEISPPQLIVLNAEAHKPVVRKVRVQNNHGEDFEVASASSRDNSIRVLSQQKVDNGYEFDVEITPPAADGSTKAFTDIFVVKIEGGEELTAFCRGFYLPDRASQGRFTGAQRAYLDWTASSFAHFLHRAEYVTLSNSTKRELEQMWIMCLERQRRQQYYEAINGLAAIKSAKAIRPLMRIAVDREQKDNRARWMATRALGILGDESAVPDLIHLVYHYHQNTRLWAQISLVRLTGVNFGYDWQQWGVWWNENNGAPPFLAETIVWTARVDWADAENQQKKDEEFFANLRQ